MNQALGSAEEDTEANERENADNTETENTEDIQIAAQQLGGGDNAPDDYEGE